MASNPLAEYDLTGLMSDLSAGNTTPDEKIWAYFSNTNVAALSRLNSHLTYLRSLDPKKIVADRRARQLIKPCPRFEARSVQSMTGKKSAAVGRTLEKMAAVLLDGCLCLTKDMNIRTTIAEIDFKITLGPSAQFLQQFRNAGTHIIGEAKCYSSGMKTEWITELIGLMNLSRASQSILFYGGPQKQLPVTHRHTLHAGSLVNTTVVPFGLTQIQNVMSGKNFLEELRDQYVRVVSNEVALYV